jgi:cellulose synthase operon protein C
VTRWLLAAAVLAPLLAGATLEECREHRRRGRLPEAKECYIALASARDPYLQAEGFWGAGDHNTANERFRAAVAARPKDAKIRVRWGELYLERTQKQEAAELFEEALEIEKDYPPALVGLASLASSRFESKAVELAEKALEKDPKYYQARELLARLALEEYNEAKAVEQADKALSINPEALDALGIRATVEWLNDKPGTEWVAKIEKINPFYGEAWAEAGGVFVINRRYEEGIKLYREALKRNPNLLHAKAELGVNLMRLGEEKEARELLVDCYEAGWRTAQVTNTLTLMDSYKNFVTFKQKNLVVRLHKRESDLLRDYFGSELERAVNTFDRKYKHKIDEPIQLEVYPDHEDFAVRTMGLPGLGALGVTFGNIVAMDSPSGRKPGSFHWASTLWHELSHVYALSITKHRVPRWFTEGLAVHEETAVNKEWGDRLDPTTIKAIQEKKLLPVATLDRGFVRPSYPAQVIVSYFQAGKICDFINEKHGWEKLLAMLHDFGKSKSTVEVITTQLGLSPEEFDKAFLAWLDTKVGAQVTGFTEWSKKVKIAAELAKAKKWEELTVEGEPLLKQYPDFVEAGSVYEMLADAYEGLNEPAKSISVLEGYARAGGRQPEVLKRLAGLLEKAGKKRQAAEVLERINYIYPVGDDAYHRKQGELWLETGDAAKAIREFKAVVHSKPVDVAGSYYNLARALHTAGRAAEAQDAVLQSLEAAPSFRPAQKLLLELSK